MARIARPLRTSAVAAVAVLLGWQVTVSGVGEALALGGRPPLSRSIDRLAPASGARWAAARFVAGDRPAASAAAIAVLRSAPLDQSALTVTALAGPPSGMSTLMGLSAPLGWRNLLTQLWLAQAGLLAGDADLFATRIDAYARQQSDAAVIFPLIDRALSARRMRAAMVTRLALLPGWRWTYLGQAGSGDPAAVEARIALLADLAAAHAPAKRDELILYVGALLHLGRDAAARSVWERFAARPDAWAGGLYDGAFAHVAGGQGSFRYEWTTMEAAGGAAWPAAGGEGAGLLLHNDGTAADPLIGQHLALRPGRYRLNVRAAGGEPRAPTAFRWAIACGHGGSLADRPGMAALDVRPGTSTYPFTVPDGCESQLITLVGVPGLPGTGTDMRIRSARIDAAG